MSEESPNEFKIINKNERLKYRLIINELRQQLKENDKLLKCYQEEEKLIADILGDKDLTIIGSRVHLKNLIVELKNKIKDRDIVIEEKEKEIEKLKITKDNAVECANLFKVALSARQKDLAIQELEKVHAVLVSKAREVVGTGVVAIRLYTINEVINQQIKELKKIKS